MSIRTKQYLRILGRGSLFMILAVIINGAACWAQLLGKTPIGHSSGIIFSGTVYQYYWPAYIGGIIIYWGLLAVSYKKLMMKHTLQLTTYIIPLRIVAWITYALWTPVMAFTQITVVFLGVGGLGGNIKPEFMVEISAIGWPAAAAVLIGADLIKKSFGQKNTEIL